MGTRVRTATPADAEALARMNREFNGVRTPVEWIRRALSRRTSREVTVIAEVGCEPAGFACLQVAHSWCYRDPVAEITEVYVAPSHRRQGIGAMLVRALLAQARARKIHEVTVQTGGRNRAGRRLYESLDFARTDHAVYRTRN